MNKLSILFIVLITISCKSKKPVPAVKTTEVPVKTVVKTHSMSLDDITLLDNKSINYFASTITKEDLQKHLRKLTSDEFEGRRTGEKGQKVAAKYLADFYRSLNIEGAVGEDNYYQHIPKSFFNGRSKNDSENVVGFIYGTEKPEEIVVISAHYDHLGIEDGVVFDGADDNGSGTAGVMEIAEAFHKAALEGEGPKRSVLFMNLTGEEEGLFGSRYYVKNPIFPLKNTIVDLNIDMIGRVDEAHKNNPNFVYVIGADKISEELHYINEAVNKKYMQLDLDYTYNDENDPNRFYYRSDHFNFAKNGIPIIFYFNGVHADYHKATDTEEKINYDVLMKRTQLVFLTAWEIANREERLKID
ncbi:MAG: M28 family metallopeptidase [Flavobacteriaceae bacterium]